MPTTITGTDGVSQVQAGAVESGDLASGAIGSGDLPAESLIQYQHYTDKTEQATSSTNFSNTTLVLDFTPKRSNSQVVISAHFNANVVTDGDGLATRFFNETASTVIEEFLPFRMDRDVGTVNLYSQAACVTVIPSWGVVTNTIRMQFKSTFGNGVSIDTNFSGSLTNEKANHLIIMEIAG